MYFVRKLLEEVLHQYKGGKKELWNRGFNMAPRVTAKGHHPGERQDSRPGQPSDGTKKGRAPGGTSTRGIKGIDHHIESSCHKI